MLTITRRWIAPDVVVPFLFGAVWIGFLITWLRAAGESAPLFTLIAAGHILIGLGLAYTTACRIVNRTTVRVGGGRLDVSHGPLPVLGRLGARSFATDRLTQLYARQASDGRSFWWGLSYEIVGRIGDEVLDLVDVRTLEEASFLERAIEKHLAIVDDGLTLERAPVPRPRSIIVVAGGDEIAPAPGYREADRGANTAPLTVRVRWPREDVGFDLALAIVLAALAIYALVIGAGTGQLPGVALLALVAAAVGSRGVANLLGHSTITLDRARLRITHGPIALRRGLDVPIDEVRSFVAVPRPRRRQNERWVAASVQLATGTVQLAPTRENDEADFLVRRLQHELSRVRGERVVDPS